MTLKPVWTEGLFITQHHLQQQDAYHEESLNERFRLAFPHAWGVAELSVDERAVARGEITVQSLRAVLPDGTVLRCGAADDELTVPVRTVGNEFSPQMEQLSVFIGLPHLRPNRPGTQLEGGAGPSTARYRAEARPVNDLNTGTSEHSVPVATPNLRIVFGGEPTEGLALLPILELVRAANGMLVPRDNFVPPVVTVGSSPFLAAGFRRVLSALLTRQRELSQGRRLRTQSAVEFQSSDAAKFWLLNALNETAPVFAHISEDGSVAPEFAYIELTRFIGKLSTFSTDPDAITLPPFQFLKLGDVFELLFAKTISLINAVIAERFTQIDLERREDGMHLGKVAEPALLRKELFLAVKGTAPEAETRGRVPRLVKIASWGQIGAILNSAVNGARLEVEFRPPGALPVRPGLTFFRVVKTPEFWPDVLSTGTVAIYHPNIDNETNELSLFAVDASDL